MPGFHQQRLERIGETGIALPLPDPRPQHHVRKRKYHARGNVDRQAPDPVSRFQPEPPRQINHGHRQNGEYIPVAQRKTDRLLPTNVQPGLRAGNVKLKRKGQPDQRPEAETQQPLDPAFLNGVA